MSLAKILDAPLILAAIAVAPQPLPRSNTDFPLTTSGLSKRYLIWKESKKSYLRWEKVSKRYLKKKKKKSFFSSSVPNMGVELTTPISKVSSSNN